jgi:hypothetical protein
MRPLLIIRCYESEGLCLALVLLLPTINELHLSYYHLLLTINEFRNSRRMTGGHPGWTACATAPGGWYLSFKYAEKMVHRELVKKSFERGLRVLRRYQQASVWRVEKWVLEYNVFECIGNIASLETTQATSREHCSSTVAFATNPRYTHTLFFY